MCGGALGTVNPAAVHADVGRELSLSGRQLAPETRRHGPLRQPLHLHLFVLALYLCNKIATLLENMIGASTPWTRRAACCYLRTPYV